MNKPKKSVVLTALLAILLLAAGVCALHAINAVSARGQVALSDCRLTDGTEEALVPLVDDPWADRGLVHIEGALMRMHQAVGAVNVRVGLIPEHSVEGEEKQTEDFAILLNTEMVRRPDLAQQYGCDDHCGFYAVAERGLLEGAGRQFRVVLVDTAEDGRRLIDTGMTVAAIDGGLAFARKHDPKEAQHAQ